MKLVGLGESAQSLLTAFSSELETLGVTFPRNSSQYVGAGEIPWDGPGLFASLGTIAQGVPGRPVAASQVSPSQVISFVKFYIQLIRECSTLGVNGGNIRIPTPKTADSEGVTALNDAGALFQAAINVKASQVIVQSEIDFAIGQVVPLGPLGGLSAMRIEIDISVDGA